MSSRWLPPACVTPLAEPPLSGELVKSPADSLGKPRQVIEVDVEHTMTSCGNGVPLLTAARERMTDDRGRRYKD